VTDDPFDKLGEITKLTITGRNMLELGDSVEALDVLKKKHVLIEEVFTARSVYYGTSLLDLVEAYLANGMASEARAAAARACAVYADLQISDHRADRLEYDLIDACQRQGHSFMAQEILRKRIDRLRNAGTPRRVDIAITLDKLGLMFIREHLYDEAIACFMEALPILETEGDTEDVAICCQYLGRAYVQSNRFKEGAAWGRRALTIAEKVFGENSVEVAKKSDELAIGLGFLAVESSSRDLAVEALEKSTHAMSLFATLDDPGSPTLARSRDNRKMLERTVAPVLHLHVDAEATPKGDDVGIALPTRLFISHSYSDKVNVERLKKVLPPYVEPIIFDPIEVPPTEAVSEKLISGLMGADGVICIDSISSNRSFWTAFERDLAARRRKHMFAFDAATGSIRPLRIVPARLMVADLFSPEDASDVAVVRRWLVEERSFEFIHGPGLLGDEGEPDLWTMPPNERQNLIFNVGLNQMCHLIFLSRAATQVDWLRDHVQQHARRWPYLTMLCWLEPPEGAEEGWRVVLGPLPRENVYSFSRRPTALDFDVHELDNLMVRLYWAFQRLRAQ
jgi:tetratricopeptide (TPR) repeat protein